ncbi:EAL domain-containing protein, partial [Mesorhizobium qingshengii]
HRNGLQPPSSIGAAFDDVELSVLITDRMLDRVLSDVAGWKRDGREVGRIAINAATADFRRGDLAERILEKVTRLGLTASVLELEVTESVLVGQMAGRVGQTLTKLRDAGVTIALDDFGTGYASLTHLQQFPVDVLKIDRSFIDKVSTDTMGSSAVVDALLQMAKAMGITSVAEGIETIAQAEYLVTRGCDLGQGYLFGRPVGRNRVLPLLDDGVGFAARPRPASAMPRY